MRCLKLFIMTLRLSLSDTATINSSKIVVILPWSQSLGPTNRCCIFLKDFVIYKMEIKVHLVASAIQCPRFIIGYLSTGHRTPQY